jgi:hypothetical protein
MKTRDVQTRLVDSTRWDHVKLRDDDIVIASWGKTGTTLTQQIVSQLVLGGDGPAKFLVNSDRPSSKLMMTSGRGAVKPTKRLSRVNEGGNDETAAAGDTDGGS